MISCRAYDHIELVCLYHYPIQITLKTGEIIKCKALDTKRNNELEECINVNVEDINRNIVLDSIAKLTVTIDNPHFKVVSFV